MEALVQARVYSAEKVALEDVVPLRTPFSAHIDVCSVCNYKCSFCFQSDMEGMKESGVRWGLMEFDLFKKIVDELMPLSDLDYLFAKSDYVVIACPLTPLTQGIVGSKELAKMKSSAFIINISRGAIIDESALINSLQQKQITGAGLDVFSTEPLNLTKPSTPSGTYFETSLDFF